jgi:hypothetical protein
MFNPELLIKTLSTIHDDSIARNLLSSIIYRDYINQKFKTGLFGPDMLSLTEEEASAIKNSVDIFMKICYKNNARKN